MDEDNSATGSSRLWPVALGVFALINVAGAAYALWMGEPSHAGVHAVLLVGAYLMWDRASWGRRKNVVQARLPDERLQYLQQSVDAIALEVERIGEAQRFHEKLMAEQDQSPQPKKDQ